jgi:xanthine dehydrogenase YagS FAD-binding subunit
VRQWEYRRPASPDEAAELLGDGRSARPMGGGTDLLTQLDRGINVPEVVVDLRPLGLAGIEHGGDGTRIGALTSVADVARDEGIAERYAALHTAASAVAAPQLREMGTVGGNLCQQPRCWFFRHPDLTCWLGGGDTCYAQEGDHRKHGLEPGDCISVAPSDLAAALLALGASVATNRRGAFPLEQLYARPTPERRATVLLEPGEFLTAVDVPAAPDASAYARAGERAAWSFALAGVAAARRGDEVRLAAIGVANVPRLLDPGDPLAGLPGLPMTGWKRRLLTNLAGQALAQVQS